MPNNPDKKSDKSKKPNKPDKKSAKKPMSDKKSAKKPMTDKAKKPDKTKKQSDLIEYDRFPLLKAPTFVRKDIYTGADIPIFI